MVKSSSEKLQSKELQGSRKIQVYICNVRKFYLSLVANDITKGMKLSPLLKSNVIDYDE